MIHDLKPYRAYRDSGVPWLDAIPAHWQVWRNGRLFTKAGDTGYPELPILEVSLKTGVRVRDIDSSTRKQIMSEREKYQRARRGDLAYNMMRMWQGAMGVAPADGLVSPAYVVARPLPGVESRYYEYLFRTGVYMDEVNQYSRGIVPDRNRLYWEQFKQIPSLVPPPDEQAAIVRFLDHADRRIRRYIRAKQKLIKLLEEQKQAIIHRAVTRGLDPDVRLKPSGVEWLGEVPEHWEVRRVRSLVADIDQGVSPQAEARLADDGAWGVLKAGCANRGVFRETEHKRLPDGFRVDTLLAVSEGDVIVSRASGSPQLVGSAARVRALQYRLILSDKTFRLRLKVTGIADFVVAAMNARYFRVQVEQAISGAEGLANNLPLSSLRDFVLAVPPTEEAIRIAAQLDSELRGLEVVVASAHQEISLLHEYRTRLIADVVTGKLDVRAVAARLPGDEVADAEPDEAELLDGEDPTGEELTAELEEVEV
jgi:type I restriction enzyme, S subunit